jgi:hypothetical protein
VNAFSIVSRSELARVDGGVFVPDGYCGTPFHLPGPPLPQVGGPNVNPGLGLNVNPVAQTGIIAILIG